MKEQILNLKKEHPDWGYKKIARTLDCSPSSVKYHISPTGKLTSDARTRRNRLQNINVILHRKKDNFNSTGDWRYTLNRQNGRKRNPSLFETKDLKAKLEANPYCYLTGVKIDLLQPKTYQLDHIIPISQGGTATLENCGLTTKVANQAKNALRPEEFFDLCKQVLLHNKIQIP